MRAKKRDIQKKYQKGHEKLTEGKRKNALPFVKESAIEDFTQLVVDQTQLRIEDLQQNE